MSTSNSRQLCVIGAAQHTDRDAEAPEPLVSWAQRAREAAALAGSPDILTQIESLQVVYCQSWPYDDPVGRLASLIGADPAHRMYSGIGGTTPQELVNRTAEAMLRGDLDLALICSAEALATVRKAKKLGARLPWRYRQSSPFPWDPPHASEANHSVFQAWETFPLWDTARRARRGASLSDDAAEAADVMAAMTRVAAFNPHAWRPDILSAAAIGTVTDANRYVGWPYTKREVAVMDVDMSAALLLATRARADALGVPENERLYLSGWAYAEDPATVAERDDLSKSAAMAVTGRHALASAGLTLSDMTAFDLYSCFPSSVRLGCDALGLALDDERGTTITGGLPYAGGPASGYVTHAIASAHDRLAAEDGHVLITGVGMHLAKHVAAVWSSMPVGEPDLADPAALQATVEADQPRHHVLAGWSGAATVLAYTVAHGRDGSAEQGLVVLDTPDGRALARVKDAELLADAESRELVGQSVVVTTDGTCNEARW
ncbi:acetyl-CoA synthetase [Mycolicibacterium sphagni]|uniref:Acetyl-CoA synthetase n=1 Tax=Mycolicibacterium sphagni TaxID=1786 RepID=A0A255DHI9_9MYCO|nr:acetyl-CoA synthetase [Mycolicibacterium sphagni]MCV7175379.1 acetyl-CoA synthetase [Mycolicibacterium sphagni]OYN76705.1 acetyl-CoA synthetase [Mycolicibacterium sphagni]